MNNHFGISKRDLGGSYLLGLAIGFVLAVVGNLFVYQSSGVSIVFGLAIGCLLAISLAYVGIQVYRNNLNDDQVWLIFQWSSLGLGITTVLVIIGVYIFELWPVPWPTFFLNLGAAGGVTGAFVAAVWSLHAENCRTMSLYRRNIVLQRVLRHNLRHSMDVMQGYADILEDDLQEPHEEMAASIRRQADAVADLNETVRNFTSLDAERTAKTIDIIDVLATQLDAFIEYHPYVTIDRSMPTEAFVRADDLIEVAIWHLLESIVHYNGDPDPALTVTVSQDVDTVSIRITDDGTGIPDQALATVRRARETQLNHTDVIGLWLVKWLVEDYGGRVRFIDDEPTGTDIWITIPTPDRPADSDSADESQVIA